MTHVDMTIEICGMSGDGTIASGQLLNAALTEAGYYLLAFDSYPAEIRGFGRCVTHTRVGEQKMLALTNRVHALISLDDEQAQTRIPFLLHNASVLYDNRPPSVVPENHAIPAHIEPDVSLFGVPFGDLASQAAGSRRGRNMVALGAFSAIFGVPQEFFHKAIEKKFKPKGDNVLDANLKCFNSGFKFASNTFKDRITDQLTPKEIKTDNGRLLLSGNEAIGKAAVEANLKHYYGYPITPATPVMEYLAKALPEAEGKMMQMEDEIAAVGAVIGSYFAGKRAMTATSGPGFALMTELIAHATVTETPAVIVNAQRGGPGTGLPTKTEQSDLQAAVFGGPGDSARIVFAPTNVTECFTHTLKSFQLAEKYQTPVIMLTDFFLHNRVENISLPKLTEEDKADCNILPEASDKNVYSRYSDTQSGISPRALPGMEGFIFTATGLEHTEKGIPDYTPETHTRMTDKRHRKLWKALEDLPPPMEFSSDGNLDVGVISWGSTFGAALEAVKKGQKEGLKVGALKIISIYPYHIDEISGFMQKCTEILIPELNYEGQLANLIGHLYPKKLRRLNRVTGVPISPMDIYDKIKTLT